MIRVKLRVLVSFRVRVNVRVGAKVVLVGYGMTQKLDVGTKIANEFKQMKSNMC